MIPLNVMPVSVVLSPCCKQFTFWLAFGFVRARALHEKPAVNRSVTGMVVRSFLTKFKPVLPPSIKMSEKLYSGEN